MSSEHDIWATDTDPIRASQEQAWYALGRNFLYHVHLDTHLTLRLPPIRGGRALLTRTYHQPIPRTLAKADTIAQQTAREHAYSTALTRFRNLIARKHFTPQDAPELAHVITEKWYAEGHLPTRTESRTVRTFLAGYIRDNPRAPKPSTPPGTLEQTTKQYELSPAAVQSLTWLREHGAENVVNIRDKTRHAITEVILMNQQESAQPAAVAQNLLTRMGSLNRDWRRIALTEAHAAHANGQLATLTGRIVEWVAAPDACPYCRQYHGKHFPVMDPKDPKRDFMRHTWVGKSNVGRSFSLHTREGRRRTLPELAGPVIPAHPHCRCRWVPTLQKTKADPRLLEYIQKRLAA